MLYLVESVNRDLITNEEEATRLCLDTAIEDVSWPGLTRFLRPHQIFEKLISNVEVSRVFGLSFGQKCLLYSKLVEGIKYKDLHLNYAALCDGPQL